MNLESPLAFDRQVSLGDMLRAVPRGALEFAMAQSVGGAWRIAGTDEQPLREGAQALAGAQCSVALVVDIETVGHLFAPAERQALIVPAGKWLELLLGASNRYRMAADLHLETVHADHRELMAKHAALAESEARYRTLNAQLEERVNEQVGLIERSQRRMYQAEKMASVGNLAAGMAHEINNPIGFIKSNLSTAEHYLAKLAQALAQQASLDAPLAEMLDDFSSLLSESTSGANRVARIVDDLKACAGAGAAQWALADPNEALRAALRMLGTLPDGVHLETELAALPDCWCDVDALTRVVLALLHNACSAMRGRSGVIRLASAQEGAELLISVRDDGCGILPQHLGRIFDPFFTTHDVGGGMGLGLSVAADVVRAHNGNISVESAPGKGSTFVVRMLHERGARP